MFKPTHRSTTGFVYFFGQFCRRTQDCAVKGASFGSELTISSLVLFRTESLSVEQNVFYKEYDNNNKEILNVMHMQFYSDVASQSIIKPFFILELYSLSLKNKCNFKKAARSHSKQNEYFLYFRISPLGTQIFQS